MGGPSRWLGWAARFTEALVTPATRIGIPPFWIGMVSREAPSRLKWLPLKETSGSSHSDFRPVIVSCSRPPALRREPSQSPSAGQELLESPRLKRPPERLSILAISSANDNIG